jgi:cell division protein FtsW (lipid II flippase)
MLYVATARWSFVAAGLALFFAGAVALYQVIPHVQARVQGWLDPWANPENQSYQLFQSLYAISSGGVFGSGLGNGVLLTPDGEPYIPFLETDFIFSAIAQELGLAGAASVILLYLIFAYRGFRISMLAQDGFSKLLAAGLTAALAIQAFIIIGGVVGLIPLTGITLPFVSYGGSSIVANFVLLALLLMVSDRVNRGERA